LCHDEPREPLKRTKSSYTDSDALPDGEAIAQIDSLQDAGPNMTISSLSNDAITELPALIQPTPVPAAQAQAFANNNNTGQST